MTTWMQYRMRSKWLEGNLLLVVLRLLREPLTKWEVLDSLYRSFGFVPHERELGKLVQALVSQGYLQASGDGEMQRLRLSREGFQLFSELEREYNAFFSALEREWKENASLQNKNKQFRPDELNEFNSLFRASVLDGLKSVLGETGVFVILKNNNLDRLIENPQHVDHVLVSIFKDFGAAVLENAIIRELFGRLNERVPDKRNVNFVSCVGVARGLYEKRQ